MTYLPTDICKAYQSAANTIDQNRNESNKTIRLASDKIDQFFQQQQQVEADAAQQQQRQEREKEAFERQKVFHDLALKEQQHQFHMQIETRRHRAQQEDEAHNKQLASNKAKFEGEFKNRQEKFEKKQAALKPIVHASARSPSPEPDSSRLAAYSSLSPSSMPTVPQAKSPLPVNAVASSIHCAQVAQPDPRPPYLSGETGESTSLPLLVPVGHSQTVQPNSSSLSAAVRNSVLTPLPRLASLGQSQATHSSRTPPSTSVRSAGLAPLPRLAPLGQSQPIHSD
ncbi:Uncharacterized protein NEOC65_001568 [Neochlamydia sp. AcF65]|uniref:hypothetical protein n=1 Tax=Neochlamydia sp. AcF65 TaxID=2795735 RepID=UPI001BC9409C|nr:hypothetical protein [Neochlamydia sp. AcF65]MBS4166480.1 Uncharacterized protein [Neochlamydia sp. AcF65]